MILSELMRPKLQSISNLLGAARKIWERDLLQWLQKNKFHFVLWGPPGSGKTTLIKILAEANNQKFVSLSAVQDGVKEIREVVRKNPNGIIFIDEIHRLSTSQQDVLLPIMEQNIVWIVGATTQSPRVSLNAPLLSRIRTIYVLSLFQKSLISVAVIYVFLLICLKIFSTPIMMMKKKFIKIHSNHLVLKNIMIILAQ